MVRLDNHMAHFRAVQHEALGSDEMLSFTVVCRSAAAAVAAAAVLTGRGVECTLEDSDVTCRAPVGVLRTLLGTEFHRCTLHNQPFHNHTCDLDLPDELEPYVIGILGLNSTPLFRPALRHLDVSSRSLTQFSPPTVAAL
jgi:hypothetical protein